MNLEGQVIDSYAYKKNQGGWKVSLEIENTWPKGRGMREHGWL